MITKPQTVGTLIIQLQKLIKDGIIKLNTPLLYTSDVEGNSYDYVHIPAEPMMFNPDASEAIVFDDYVENHYNELKSAYKEMLRETGKYHGDLDSVTDGREEFVYESMREDSEGVFTCCIN